MEMVSNPSPLVPPRCDGANVDVSCYCWTAFHCSAGFRWEEERYTDGVKWKFLEHKGPVFAPPYEPLPSNVKFYYDGKTRYYSSTQFSRSQI